MKKILSLMLSVFIVFSSIIICFATDSASINLDVSSASLSRGDEVTVTVKLQNCKNAKSMGLEFAFDTSDIFEIVSGQWLLSNAVISNFDMTKNAAVIAYGSESNFNGNIFSLKLKVKDTATIGVATVAVTPIIKCGTEIIDCAGASLNLNITDVCSHSNKTKIDAKESTCKVQGNDAYYRCDDCGQLFSADGATEVTSIPFRSYANHKGGTATCKSLAVCSVCGSSYGNYGSHSYTAQTKTEATLKTAGTCTTEAIYYYSCSVCGACENNSAHTFKGSKNTDNHTGGTEIRNAVNATCGKAGYTGDIYCKDCGTKISSGSTVSATGNHSWNSGVITTAATCKSTGVKTFTCTVCSSTKTEVIAKNASNHTGGTELKNVVNASCGKAGYTGDTFCKGCGIKLSNGSTVNATGNHSWNNGVVTTVPTCKNMGVKTYTCSVCSSTKTEAIAKEPNNHTGNNEIKNKVDATCGESGYTGDTYCKDCEKLIECGNTVNATGNHTWNSGVVTTVATCKDMGIKTYTCTVCSATKTEAIGKNTNNHTGGTEIRNKVSATCGKAGYTGDTYCKGCGVKLSNGSTIQATGKHSWNSGVVTTVATCKSTGVKTYTCTVCSSTKTEVIAKNSSNHTGGTEVKNAISATCGKAGYTGDTYCKGCGVKLSEGTTVNATGNHTWNSGEVTTVPTCKDNGVKTYTCTVCKVTKTEDVAKTDSHTFGEWTVKTAATYEADGEEIRTCSVCGKEETKTIAKLVAAETAGDEETGVQMNFAEGTFTEKNVTLEVKPTTKDTEVYKVVSNLKPDNNFEIFDITAMSGETKVQPNGNVQISIPLSDKFDSENVSIYYVNDKGEMEKLQSYVKDGKIVFETNHFSYYVVIDEASPKTSDVTLGDVNSDGKINTKDARKILRYVAKLEKFTTEQESAADVNKDTKINTKDARKILRVVAKLESM